MAKIDHYLGSDLHFLIGNDPLRARLAPEDFRLLSREAILVIRFSASGRLGPDHLVDSQVC